MLWRVFLALSVRPPNCNVPWTDVIALNKLLQSVLFVLSSTADILHQYYYWIQTGPLYTAQKKACLAIIRRK